MPKQNATARTPKFRGWKVSIHTDFDPAGRKLNARLRELLDDSQVDPEWRRPVGAALTPHGRRDIESLTNLFRRRW
jgi:5S rRNA maturation endonuclease (ribonuclease M5)